MVCVCACACARMSVCVCVCVCVCARARAVLGQCCGSQALSAPWAPRARVLSAAVAGLREGGGSCGSVALRPEGALQGPRVWVRVAGGEAERGCEWGCGAREVCLGEAGPEGGRARPRRGQRARARAGPGRRLHLFEMGKESWGVYWLDRDTHQLRIGNRICHVIRWRAIMVASHVVGSSRLVPCPMSSAAAKAV